MKRMAVLALLLACWSCKQDQRGKTDKNTARPQSTSSRVSDLSGLLDRFAATNIILISLDTLRADYLGCYGYERNTSPNLDAWAEQALLFERAYSSAPKTAESHMSMFTGIPPVAHGVQTRLIHREKKVSAGGNTLNSGIITITELLKADGFQTVGFHDGGNIAGELGFARGFDSYERGALAAGIQWLESPQKSDEKFFLFLHTYHVHDPYTPESPYDALFVDKEYQGRILHSMEQLIEESGPHRRDYATLFWSRVDKESPHDIAHLRNLYAGVVRELDVEMGRLFGAIDSYAPNSTVIVLSDHGEALGERGHFVHDTVFNEVLHVPLIIRHPNQQKGMRVSSPVGLIDIAPTILALAGIDAPAHMTGNHFFRELSDTEQIDSSLPTRKLRASQRKHRKVMAKKDKVHFFDLAKDPGETDSLASQRLQSVPEFQGLYRQMQDNYERSKKLGRKLRSKAQRPAELSPETLEELRMLGYIE